MKKLILGTICLFLFLQSCSDNSFSYTISEKANKEIKGELWKTVDSSFCYVDVLLTDSYYVFSDYENDTVLHVYDKNNPAFPVGYGLMGEKPENFVSVEFVKSNTRYPSGKDDVWIVDSKHSLKQVECKEGEVALKSNSYLPGNLTRSFNYNFTPEELYATPSRSSNNNAFFFFNPDSGYYWVDMYAALPKEFNNNPYAFLSEMIVNEKENVAVCAFRFFNKVHFFDLRGNIFKEFLVGEETIKPQRTQNFLESYKCFIDIYGTSRYVYCVYDGSIDFSPQTKIMVFRWDGKHIKTLQTDRSIKKIAVDPQDKYFIAIATNEQGGRDVLRYSLK